MIAWVEAFLKELNLRLDKDQDVSYHIAPNPAQGLLILGLAL